VPAAQAKPPVEATTPRIDSRTWFAHHRVIEIDHHGTIYRLRCTSQGKLILTK
jgi:hemin uptake protein HemP